MQIFFLDTDPVLAGQALHNRHLVKMPVASAQIMCTIAAGFGLDTIYKPLKKPKWGTITWVGATVQNWDWHATYAFEMCNEYALRFGRVHAAWHVVNDLAYRSDIRDRLLDMSLLPFPMLVPVAHWDFDTVKAYRDYYIARKLSYKQRCSGLHMRSTVFRTIKNRWTPSERQPSWIPQF